MFSVRIINKVKLGNTMMQEMRVFVERADGSPDRIGTLSTSMRNVALLKRMLVAGAEALNMRLTITEPNGSMPDRG